MQDVDRNALELLREARKEVDRIYAPALRIRDQLRKAGDGSAEESKEEQRQPPATRAGLLETEQLAKFPLSCLCDEAARSRLDEHMRELVSLLVLQKNRQKGEKRGEQLAKARQMIGDLHRSERKSRLLALDVREARQVVMRRSEIMSVARSNPATQRTIRALQIVSNELGELGNFGFEIEEGKIRVSLDHQTSEEFCFLASVLVEPKEGGIEEASIEHEVNAEESTFESAGEDLKRVIVEQRFDDLRLKIRRCVAKEKFLCEHREHKLWEQDEKVQKGMEAIGKDKMPVDRWMDGPSITYLPSASHLRRKTAQNVDGMFTETLGGRGQYLARTVQVHKPHSLVFTTCALPEMAPTEKGGDSKRFLLRFELEPPVPVTIEAAKALASMKGVGHVGFDPVLRERASRGLGDTPGIRKGAGADGAAADNKTVEVDAARSGEEVIVEAIRRVYPSLVETLAGTDTRPGSVRVLGTLQQWMVAGAEGSVVDEPQRQPSASLMDVEEGDGKERHAVAASVVVRHVDLHTVEDLSEVLRWLRREATFSRLLRSCFSGDIPSGKGSEGAEERVRSAEVSLKHSVTPEPPRKTIRVRSSDGLVLNLEVEINGGISSSVLQGGKKNPSLDIYASTVLRQSQSLPLTMHYLRKKTGRL